MNKSALFVVPSLYHKGRFPELKEGVILKVFWGLRLRSPVSSPTMVRINNEINNGHHSNNISKPSTVFPPLMGLKNNRATISVNLPQYFPKLEKAFP